MLSEEIHNRLLGALGAYVVTHSDARTKPLDLSLSGGLPPRMRVYGYTLTCPPGGRSINECKIQVILPAHDSSKRGDFSTDGGYFVLLFGYAPDLDVGVFWDATLYRAIPYSRNVQVRRETIVEASIGRIVTQHRRLRSGDERVIAFPMNLVVQAIRDRFRLTVSRLIG